MSLDPETDEAGNLFGLKSSLIFDSRREGIVQRATYSLGRRCKGTVHADYYAKNAANIIDDVNEHAPTTPANYPALKWLILSGIVTERLVSSLPP